ncbi:MAG TPA: phosphate transport system regulatory protein PhoU [Gallionellaceae bacterium]|nr:phosphate transport system regulatory protein PhoU [Gallionellaceae bacterium]
MSNTKHTLTQFDEELEAVREQVMQMGSLVENQIRLVMEALFDNDIALMERVIDNDRLVNGMEVAIDEKCVQIIARRQPAANDLRLVMTVIKTITDIERIGDEAKKIARMAIQLSHREHFHTPRYTEIRHAAKLVLDMLHQALDSFARLDVSGVTRVIRQDELVDNEFRTVLRYLVTLMMEDPRTISGALEMLFIAKSVERMGDHAQNMAEYMVYMIKGRNARHISVEKIEDELQQIEMQQPPNSI